MSSVDGKIVVLNLISQRLTLMGCLNLYVFRYIKLVKKHKLEISQPGLDPSSKGLTWQMTKRREDLEVHK